MEGCPEVGCSDVNLVGQFVSLSILCSTTCHSVFLVPKLYMFGFFFLNVCPYNTWSPHAQGDQNNVPDLLGLELEIVVNCRVVARIKLSPAGATC